MGDCHDKALELVARRPHFRRELDQKLLRRGFSRDDIESTLDGLSQAGVIDDPTHARDLALGPMARKDFGPRRVRAELIRRGVDEELAETVVSETFSGPEEELRRAREAALKRTRTSAMEDSRLGRYLDRKGYSKSVILRILEEIDPG